MDFQQGWWFLHKLFWSIIFGKNVPKIKVAQYKLWLAYMHVLWNSPFKQAHIVQVITIVVKLNIKLTIKSRRPNTNIGYTITAGNR